jgi:tRNA nucleotidyltransferase (CCA-adding enzyme)
VRTRSGSTSSEGSAVGPLPRDLARRVSEARALARERRIRLYLVGGAVRDLLLRRPVTDVDLVVERDASGFARELARRLGATVKLHGRFGTAVVETRGERLDVGTSRAEDYERPAALPRVRAGSIADDLARRDFTVNAMAIEIVGAGKPRLLDPFDGRKDITHRVIRMLHPRSAFDDPTRAFRAVRYASRLGFRIDPATRRWIREAISEGVLDGVSGDRLRREIALLFSEGNRSAAVRSLSELGLVAAVHPSLRFDAAAARRLRTAERLAEESGSNATWLVYLLSWMGTSSEEAAREIAARLNLPREAAKVVRGWPRISRALLSAAAGDTGRAVAATDGISDDEILAAAASLPARARARLLEARRAAPGLRLRIRGRDLLAAGVPPGPAIGRALSATLSARRDGAIGADDELAFALAAARP